MMRKFINMNFLKNNTINNYTLEHFTIIKDSFYTLINKIPPGEYVRLINKYDCIMSNTPMELQTNQDFINNAYKTDLETYSNSFGSIIINAKNIKTNTKKTIVNLETE